MKIWDSLPKNQYLSLAPWTWVQLESADPPGPFPFVAGWRRKSSQSLHEAHGLLSSAIDTAISDVLFQAGPARRSRSSTAIGRCLCGGDQRPPLSAAAHSLRAEAGRYVSMGVSDRPDQIRHGHQRRAPDLPFREAAGDSDRVRPATVGAAGGKGTGVLGRHASDRRNQHGGGDLWARWRTIAHATDRIPSSA